MINWSFIDFGFTFLVVALTFGTITTFIKELMRLTCDDKYGHIIICCHTKLPLYTHTICGVTQLFVAILNYEILYSPFGGFSFFYITQLVLYLSTLTIFDTLKILGFSNGPS
jgi:hypothetical protein